MRRSLLALIALAVSCSHARVAAPAPSPAPDEVLIRIEPAATSRGTWRVTWRLPRPVSEVRFSRPGHGDRAAHWTVATAGLSLSTEAGVDRIRSSGPPFRTLEVVVAEYARKPEKDYQVFIPFTDGSVLLFTGAFDVDTPEGGPSWTLAYALVPRSGEAVVVGGARHLGATTWGARGDGTYACFGTTPSTETPFGVAVVDRGMPSWLRDRTLALAPEVFARYASGTRQPLAERPTFFLSYGVDPTPGSFSFGGGTLAGVVQLDTRLGARHTGEENPEVWEKQARLLAHEAAHLWLDHAFKPAGSAGRWLDEGGADAFALRALVDLGVMSRDRFHEVLSADSAECLRLLEEGPLSEAARAGRWKALYRCGEVASFLAEAAASRRAPPWDLLQFWGQVFWEAPERTYDEENWFSVLAALPGGPEASDVVRRMVDRPDPSIAAAVDALLRVGAWPAR